jgi:hypothetical protein
MSWPLSQDYNEAVQAPAASFADPDLRQGQPALNVMGLPLPRSGNFADVYEFSCPSTGTKWAVKCFTRHVPGQRDRYAAISQHLRQAKLPFTVDFQYIEQGIRVLGQWYPVLKMRWVEGLLLNAFVRDNIDKPALLHALSQIWLRMARRLREARVTHADLQHGNVILVPGSKTASLAVKLIDYDGMWVPALADKPSGEVGHPNFQHPQRLREGTYSPEVDRFPELVVATGLRALALGGRSLWERYDTGENILFAETDLRAPAESKLFAELRGVGDPLLNSLVGQLHAAAVGKLESTPLLEKLVPEEKRAKGKAADGGIDWSFADGDQSPRWRPRGVGVPLWAWPAAAVVLAVLALGSVFFLTRNSGDRPRQVARNGQPKETPTTAKSPPGETTDKQPPEHSPNTDLVQTPVQSPPPDLPKPDPEKKPERPRVEGRPAGVVQLVGTTPPLMAAVLPGKATWESYAAGKDAAQKRYAGHKGAVTCLAVTPDGRSVLSGSEDRTLRLWDVESKESLRVLEGHDFPVVASAISADGKRGLSADMGPRVRLWDLETGQEIGQFDHPGGVASVALSADGKRILAGLGQVKEGAVFPVCLWDADTGTLRKTFRGHTAAVLSVAFAADEGPMASSSADGTVRLWKAGSETEEMRFSDLTGPVHQVAFSPNGHLLIGTAGAVTRFWNLATGKSVRAGKQEADAAAACILPDGRALWCWRSGATLRFEDIPDPEKETAVVVKPPPAPEPRSEPDDRRRPVPTGAALARAETELHFRFRDLYDSKSPLLPNKLWDVVTSRGKPDVKYVALKELREDAVQKGDIRSALNYAGRIGETFRVNRLEAKVEVVEAAAAAALTAQYHQEVASRALRLIDQAEAEDEHDLASRLADAARTAEAKAPRADLSERVQARAAEVAAARAAFGPVKQAQETLARDPDNAEAKTTAGRFDVVYRDAWDEGLPLLAGGSDGVLKELAKKDLARPGAAQACKEVGDGWWDVGEKEKAGSPEQKAFRRRAYQWYRSAGSRTETRERMETVAREQPDVRSPWRHLDVSEGTVNKGDSLLRLEKGQCAFTRRWYKGGIDVTVEARTGKTGLRLTAGQGGLLMFNWDDRGTGMTFLRPDDPSQDGRGVTGGSQAGRTNGKLAPNTWHLLHWQLAPTGMKVWLDNKPIFAEEHPNDLSVPRPVGVCSSDSPIEVRSVVVKPLTAAPLAKK